MIHAVFEVNTQSVGDGREVQGRRCRSVPRLPAGPQHRDHAKPTMLEHSDNLSTLSFLRKTTSSRETTS